MPPYITYIATPLIGALIGYFTNWLAIKMLFRPHTEKRIFGVRIPFTPGLIPKERARLTVKIADTVSAHVLTPEVLSKELASANIWRDIKEKLTAGEGTVGEALARFGVNSPVEWVENALTEALKDEKIRGAVLSEALAESLRRMLNGLLPGTVAAAEKWMADNPWMDERLEALVRKIVHENFKFIGVFIDHKKIYANIKTGVFQYLTDTENQQFLLDKVDTAIAGFRADGFTGGDSAEENPVADKIVGAARRVCEYICGLKTHKVLEYMENAIAEWRLFEKIAGYIANHMKVRDMIEEKLNAFAVEEAEALILGVVNRELQAITVLGGVLGFIIGLVSLIPQVL